MKAVAAILVALVMMAEAPADIFHLHTGGMVNGQLLGVEDGRYEVRTVVGVVHLPVGDVERIEQAATPFEEYDERLRQADDTPADQTALAAWCGEQELLAMRREHLSRAIELDPDYIPARRALGHVRVGEWWVDARTVADGRGGPLTAEDAADAEAERLARAVRGQWRRRIRAIKRSFLDQPDEAKTRAGWDRVLEIKDPLAIGPLAEVLTGGDVGQRVLLVKALGTFPQDEATMNLAFIALIDPDAEIRRRAVAQLVPRADPRVVAQYRRALRARNDVILRRAAYGLGELNARAAIPDLIDLLTVRKKTWVEVPLKDYFEVWPNVWNSPERNVYSFGPLQQQWYTPGRGRWYIADQVVNEWRYRMVTVFRTEVLEALRRMSGENFGFDRGEWQSWYAAQQQQP